jgi:thiol-disulfide isomerase/thioredoxin
MPTIKLTTEGFKKEVFDYTTKQEWDFQGELPAIVDFYADWCGPCKMVSSILVVLSDDFS